MYVLTYPKYINKRAVQTQKLYFPNTHTIFVLLCYKTNINESIRAF